MRGEVGGIRPDARLGERERGQLLAARLGNQPALALLLGRPLQEGQRVEPDVDALDDAEGRVGPLQLLAQQREADVVHAGAAVRLRDRRPEEALLAHLGEELAVDLALLVPLADVRQDLRLGEGARALLDQAVLVGQAEVDHRRDASSRPRRPSGTRDGDAPRPPVYSSGPPSRSPDGMTAQTPRRPRRARRRAA